MTSLIPVVLLIGGTAFMIIAAIGLIRLPDLYTRMHAITKAGSLGVMLVLTGIAVAFGDLSVTTRAVAVILFVLLTAPVSAHMIGRAGYLGNVPLWDGTVFDQWNATFDQLRREDDVTDANAREREVNTARRSAAGRDDASDASASPDGGASQGASQASTPAG